MDSRTTIFNVNDLRQELILMTITEIMNDLEYKGYNATNQIVGYLTTGDETYITSYNNARKKITKFNRNEILMAIINGYRGR
jgi:uncharacterized protein (UPF0297 family)